MDRYRSNPFIDSFIYFWRNYCQFSGRATRSQFWWNQLWYYAVIVIYAAGVECLERNEFMYMFGSFMVIFVTITILPKFALSIRRYRDIGLSNVTLWIYTFCVLALNVGAGLVAGEIGHLLVLVNNVLTFCMFLLALLPSDYLSGRATSIFLRSATEEKE